MSLLLQIFGVFVCLTSFAVCGDAALPIMWPEQYTVHQATVMVKMLHMRECKPEGG